MNVATTTTCMNLINSTPVKTIPVMNETEIDIPLPFLPTQDDGTKVIEGEFHTLFISDEDPVLEEIEIVHEGEPITVVKEAVPKHKKYTLYIETFGHRKRQLHKINYELRKATEHDVLEIRIQSPGGYVSEGISIYNTMRELFTGRTVTYLDSDGASMGAMLFSLGDQRVAYEDSTLMYHNYSTGYGGKGGEIKAYVDYEDEHFDKFFRKRIVNEGFLTEDEYERMRDGKDFWLDSLEMAKRGITTHVIVSGFKLDNEAFIEYAEQDLTIEEWAMKKIAEMQAEAEEEAQKAEEEAEAKAKKAEEAKKKREAKKKTTTKK